MVFDPGKMKVNNNCCRRGEKIRREKKVSDSSRKELKAVKAVRFFTH